LAELVVILVFISFELGIALLQELYLVLKLAQVCLALAHLVDLMLKLGDEQVFVVVLVLVVNLRLVLQSV
jgi:hypothetical protein